MNKFHYRFKALKIDLPQQLFNLMKFNPLKSKLMYSTAIILLALLWACESDKEENEAPTASQQTYTMPEESEPHEGTWLQWPHQYQYGGAYRNSLDASWVAMTNALVTGENVHIIAYNDEEKNRITNLLNASSVLLEKVDFYLFKTDDVWVRDNGPIYVRDETGNLVIQDWGFNGWGEKTDDWSRDPIQFSNCNTIPTQIGAAQNRTVVDLNNIMINEGGSAEIDGHGALMACRSSILNNNRNPGMTQQ